jgi:hypothetical protein
MEESMPVTKKVSKKAIELARARAKQEEDDRLRKEQEYIDSIENAKQTLKLHKEGTKKASLLELQNAHRLLTKHVRALNGVVIKKPKKPPPPKKPRHINPPEKEKQVRRHAANILELSRLEVQRKIQEHKREKKVKQKTEDAKEYLGSLAEDVDIEKEVDNALAEVGEPKFADSARDFREISELRAKGESLFDIQAAVKSDLSDIAKKMEILEKYDAEVAERANPNQKKREIDLQLLLVTKKLHYLADNEEKGITKIEAYKVIKDLLAQRAKLWGADGNAPSVRMGNVENLVIGGNMDRKQLHLIGDILSGRVKQGAFGRIREEIEYVGREIEDVGREIEDDDSGEIRENEGAVESSEGLGDSTDDEAFGCDVEEATYVVKSTKGKGN